MQVDDEPVTTARDNVRGREGMVHSEPAAAGYRDFMCSVLAAVESLQGGDWRCCCVQDAVMVSKIRPAL